MRGDTGEARAVSYDGKGKVIHKSRVWGTHKLATGVSITGNNIGIRVSFYMANGLVRGQGTIQ